MSEKKPRVRKGTIKRLLSYIFKNYKKQAIIVLITIVVSSIADAYGSLFLQSLIDDYITPLIGVENPVFTSLLYALGIMAIVYVVGIICTYIYNRTMATVAQGVLRDIRDDMFDKMEKLPIKYFDTHSHGDIMSHYTNDTDTLRQMISQGLPQLLQCFMSIVTIFIAMVYLCPTLAGFVAVFSLIIVFLTKVIGSRSSKYFMSQQTSLGKVNGYIEEMLNGQKVIKVFTHEEKAKEGFDVLNDKLNDDMYRANKYVNILMPIANNLGNLQYVLIAIVRNYSSFKWHSCYFNSELWYRFCN